MKIYKQVYLPIDSGLSGDLVGDIGVADSFCEHNLACCQLLLQILTARLHQSREDIVSVTATWFSELMTISLVPALLPTQVVDFTETAAKVTTGAPGGNIDRMVNVTLDALANGSVTETTTKYVGRDAELTVTATDYAGQSSSFTITLKKGSWPGRF